MAASDWEPRTANTLWSIQYRTDSNARTSAQHLDQLESAGARLVPNVNYVVAKHTIEA
jgi:hypothetical protein